MGTVVFPDAEVKIFLTAIPEVRTERRYRVFVDGKLRERWPFGDLWHFALFQPPGSPIGRNPIEVQRQTIGASLAAQQFGAQFFDSGGHPTVFLKMPGADPGVEEAKALKARIIDTTRGSREPMLMPNGWSMEKVDMACVSSA